MIKRLIQKTLNSAGWELRKLQPEKPGGMETGLSWLKSQNVAVNTVIDVGASNGQWSNECMRLFPSARYLLFEPHPSHSADLDAFVVDHAPNVIADKRAVGVTNGSVRFDASDLFGGGIDSSGNKEGSILVPQVTMDTAVEESSLEGPYLVKLDTHGFEKGILEGASKTLDSTHALVVECYNFRIEPDCLLFWEFCAFLAEKGFRPVQLVDVLNRKLDQCLWQMDLFFIRSDWDGFRCQKYR